MGQGAIIAVEVDQRKLLPVKQIVNACVAGGPTLHELGVSHPAADKPVAAVCCGIVRADAGDAVAQQDDPPGQ
jgi:hypothetical protein